MRTKWGVITATGLIGLVGVVACDEAGSSVDAKTFNANLEENRIACVDKINAFRATLDLPPYARWTEGETCADMAAKNDAKKNVPHDAFLTCDEWAQNECPQWRSVERVLGACFQMMWDEGPGEDYSKHGHYTAMAHEGYTQVACGFYRTDSGEVWAVQNFQ